MSAAGLALRTHVKVQVRTVGGTWQDATAPIPLRTAQAVVGFYVAGTTSRFLYVGKV